MSSRYTPKVMREPTVVRELARAAEIVDKVRRESSSSHGFVKKGCEKVQKGLNGMIVEMLKEERDD